MDRRDGGLRRFGGEESGCSGKLPKLKMMLLDKETKKPLRRRSDRGKIWSTRRCAEILRGGGNGAFVVVNNL